MDERTLSPEDRAVLDALEDPEDIEAFKNIVDNAQAQGKTGVALVQENPQHTSRKAVRKLCFKDKKGVFAAFFRRLFGHGSRSGDPPDATPLDFMKPSGQGTSETS